MKTFYTIMIAVFWAITVSAQTNNPSTTPSILIEEDFEVQGVYRVAYKNGAMEWKEISTTPTSGPASSPGDTRHIITSGNSNSGLVMRNLSTAGYELSTITWLQYRGSGFNGTEVKLARFGYSYVNSLGTTQTGNITDLVYTNIDGTPISAASQPVSKWYRVTATLPDVLNNRQNITLDWDITSPSGNGNDDSRSFRFDNVKVSGFESVITFTALTSSNPNTLVLEAPLSTPALKKYIVSGKGLKSDVNITASTSNSLEKFKISLTETYSYNFNDPAYKTSITLPIVNGTLAETEIWVLYVGSVKETSTANGGTFIGQLNHTSTGVSGLVALEGVTSPNPPAPFPVELSTFSGQAQKGAAKLTWTTASEKNNDKFVVERSQDGKNFSPVGEVKGSGNSATKRSYSFTDNATADGINYYRLRQVDFDGTETLSNVIALEVTGGSLIATVYPTEASVKAVTIRLQNVKGDATISVIDATGRPVATFTNTTAREIELPVHNLRSGMYFVRVTDGQSQQVQRFIKK